jgi:pimeloyl-ACP methyl ester carboxylesterase
VTPNTHHRVGTGPHCVIAIHGWFTDRHGFAAMEDALDHTAFSYAFMDIRGYGDLQKADGPYTMDQVAIDALELADALGWQTFSVIGHSMGAKAVQRVLVRAPERVRKVVALTPVPASSVPFDEQGWALFSGAPERPENRYAIIDFTTGNRLTPTWINHMVTYSLAHSTREAFADYLTSWAKDDFSAEVKGRSHPVLVLVGAHDPALSAEVMEATWLAWYPNATLEVMPNAGHYPMDETPIALATAIEAFLRK